jgi:hypothetical protein
VIQLAPGVQQGLVAEFGDLHTQVDIVEIAGK